MLSALAHCSIPGLESLPFQACLFILIAVMLLLIALLAWLLL